MLGRVIKGFFENLQDFLNPYKIYFDTFYTPNIDDYRLAMSSYNARKLIDFNPQQALHLTDQQLKNFTDATRPGGKSYNCIQYKYSPLKHSDKNSNSHIYYIAYSTQTGNIKVTDITGRKYLPLEHDQAQALLKTLELDKQEYYQQSNLADIVAGEIIPQVSIDTKPTTPLTLQRLGIYAESDIDCRFLTTNTTLFEDFMIVYNAILHKRNPHFTIGIKDFKDTSWTINTEYSEINEAGQVDYWENGNLLQVTFSTKLTTMFLSNYTTKALPLNQVITTLQPVSQGQLSEQSKNE